MDNENKNEMVAPGIYDISNEAYHNGPGISKTGIGYLLRSPAHYWERYLNPEREQFKETEAMRIGKALHKLVLEPFEFEDEFWIVPKDISAMNKNTKIYKEYIAIVRSSGKTPILFDQFENIKKMANSIEEHPKASLLTRDGQAEKTFYWQDSDTGVLCKCRPDYWKPKIALPDLKTTDDARPDKFKKSCASYEYYIQAPFYADGVEALTGEALPMPFIAIEKETPFALNTFVIEDPDIALGRAKYKYALEIVARCFESDEWPPYPPEIKMISLPSWARK